MRACMHARNIAQWEVSGQGPFIEADKGRVFSLNQTDDVACDLLWSSLTLAAVLCWVLTGGLTAYHDAVHTFRQIVFWE